MLKEILAPRINYRRCMAEIAAQWATDPTGRNESRYWDGALWTDHVSNRGVPGTDPLQPSPPRSVTTPGMLPSAQVPANAMRDDPDFMHFLRFIGIWILMAFLFYVVVGLVWMAFALSSTGRRKRDILMLLVPVWGTIVVFQTLWRYTSRYVYWSVRSDRPSKPLFST